MDLRPLDFESSASTNFTTPPNLDTDSFSVSWLAKVLWIIERSSRAVKGLYGAKNFSCPLT